MSTDAPKPSGHFPRLNALVEGGWLAVLTDAEKSLWIAYTKFADRDGVAYPDGSRLAALLGHATTTHVGRVRQRLERYGLLKVLEPGGGRGHPCKVQLLDPPARAVNGKGKGCQTGTLFPDADGPETLPISTRNIANPAQKHCRSERGLNKEEQTIEQPREQTRASAGKPRGGAGSKSAGANEPRKRTAERKLSDGQQAVREAFSDWWTFEAWPAAHDGLAYEFGSRDAQAILRLLASPNVAWDLATAKAVAAAFLADRSDRYLLNLGHKLWLLPDRLVRFVQAARKAGSNGHNGHGDDGIKLRVLNRVGASA